MIRKLANMEVGDFLLRVSKVVVAHLAKEEEEEDFVSD
jgi:hypothetical protein